ncbi:MAG: hypothetical protein ACLP9L_14245 [Thermoguttaceae bacterium]
MRITPFAFFLLSFGMPAAISAGYVLGEHVSRQAHANLHSAEFRAEIDAQRARDLKAFQAKLGAAGREQDHDHSETIEAFVSEYTRRYQEASANHDEAELRRLDAIAQKVKGLIDDK